MFTSDFRETFGIDTPVVCGVVTVDGMADLIATESVEGPNMPLLSADPAPVEVNGLDLRPSTKSLELRQKLIEFMNEQVVPAEAEYQAYRQEAGPDDHTLPPVVEPLQAEAKQRGLWNLFLPAVSGIGQLDYAGLAEITGWSLELAPEAINGQAPDTGNMELLHLFGTDEQKKPGLSRFSTRRCGQRSP